MKIAYRTAHHTGPVKHLPPDFITEYRPADQFADPSWPVLEEAAFQNLLANSNKQAHIDHWNAIFGFDTYIKDAVDMATAVAQYKTWRQSNP